MSDDAPAAAGEPPHVLVVEDDPTARAMLSAWLHTEGCRFEVAGDARAARVALAAREFDLLLCDVQLPDLDGPEIVAAIEGANRGIPVIFLTGQPSLETAMRSVRLRVVAYLVKPPDLDELRRLLRQSVAQHRVRRALGASRRRLQEWDAELAGLEQGVDEAATPSALGHLQVTLRQLGAVLAELDRSVAALAGEPQGRTALAQIDLVASLRRTVRVLESTRQQFKSKPLGELRSELETVLRRIGASDEADAPRK